MNTSPRYQLIQTRLDRDLAGYVRERWEANTPWRDIAADLRTATDVQVSHETLRAWFPALRSSKTRRAVV